MVRLQANGFAIELVRQSLQQDTSNQPVEIALMGQDDLRFGQRNHASAYAEADNDDQFYDPPAFRLSTSWFAFESAIPKKFHQKSHQRARPENRLNLMNAKALK
jgi:hypothetical protein